MGKGRETICPKCGKPLARCKCKPDRTGPLKRTRGR